MKLGLGLKLSHLKTTASAESNMVLNPNFDDTSVWTQAGNVNITGGVLDMWGTDHLSYAKQTINGLVINDSYKIEWEITEYTSGNVTARLENQNEAQNYYNSVGVHSQTITPSTTSDTYYIQGRSDTGFDGKIDNVKLIKL